MVDPNQGQWHLRKPDGGALSFHFGNPKDIPFLGDWDCDGTETPGLYRRTDGLVYLRNSNTAGIADTSFFFGNPGDVPVAGDFDGDGCDTVSIYRPSEQRFFIVNELGADGKGLGAADTSYVFGNEGDSPFVGDFDGDGIETVGLHRESTGLVFLRNSHTQGVADNTFLFGDPGDLFVAGDWDGDANDTAAVFRPSDAMFYLRHSNTQGAADEQFEFGESGWIPIAGTAGLAPPGPDELGFLTLYRETTFSEYDDGSNTARIGRYESKLIEFPDLPGRKLTGVTVTLEPQGDELFTAPASPTRGDPGELLELDAHVMTPEGPIDLPVVRDADGLQAFSMEVPDSALGLQFTVQPASPDVVYYTVAYADVTLDSLTAVNLLNQRALGLNAFVAAEALVDASKVMENDLKHARRAETFARAAFAALEKPFFSDLLKRAQEELDKALKSLKEAKDNLKKASDSLGKVPGAEKLKAMVDELIKQICARIPMVEAHYFVYTHTTNFYDVPGVTVNVGAASTNYVSKTMKLNLSGNNHGDSSVVKHEYGHAVFRKKTGLPPTAGKHNLCGKADPKFAYSEGWATFFSGVAMNDPKYADVEGGVTGMMDLEANTLNGTPCRTKGSDVEMNVQAALWDIVDGPQSGITDTDGDGLSVPFSLTFDCLCPDPKTKTVPDTFDAFIECLRKRLDSSANAALTMVLANNNIP